MSSIFTPWKRTQNVLEPFRQELEGLFGRFFGDEGENGPLLKTWSPRIDMEETEKEISVKCDLPGIDPHDIEITVTGNVLTVRGEKKDERVEQDEKKKNYHRVERLVGKFFREIPLPAGCDGSNITATSSKGVVSITIPKSPEALPKKVAVISVD
jgi:HSP20 family protein